MNSAFFRTARELGSDNSIGSIMLLGIITCLMGAWVGWLFLARVTIYRASDQARIELVNGAVHVDAPVRGRIVATHLALGDDVHAGDLLVELDAQLETRELDEDKARLTALAPQLSKVTAEIKAAEDALASDEQAAHVALDQARVKWEGAETEWTTAHEIAKRFIAAGDAVPQVEVLARTGAAKSRLAVADSLHLEVQRLGSELKTKQSDRVATIQQLRQDWARLEGEEETTRAGIKRLEYETERHDIRAPVSGRVVEIAGLGIGTFIPEGGRLGTIAPPKRLKAVADFSSSEVLGHIVRGQRAWLRLNGFPWTQYGTISATVVSIASEQKNGLVRVDLGINPNSDTRIPIQEGLLGSAEVEVEHTSPATLILRAAGTLMTKSDTSARRALIAPEH
jgi:membrane fusion protein (multidrug efflux system)